MNKQKKGEVGYEEDVITRMTISVLNVFDPRNWKCIDRIYSGSVRQIGVIILCIIIRKKIHISRRINVYVLIKRYFKKHFSCLIIGSLTLFIIIFFILRIYTNDESIFFLRMFIPIMWCFMHDKNFQSDAKIAFYERTVLNMSALY